MNRSPENNVAVGTASHLTDDLRAVFCSVADVLIPATAAMPSAGQVGVHGPMIDRLLEQRPDQGAFPAGTRGLQRPGPASRRAGLE